MRIKTTILATLLLAACNIEINGPDVEPQMYVLRELANKTIPPTASDARTPGATLADTLRIFIDESLVEQTIVMADASGSPVTSQNQYILPQPPDGIAMDLHCIPGYACAAISAPVFGHFRGDSLVFEANNWNVKRVYVREVQ